jgi:hypothetical protein
MVNSTSNVVDNIIVWDGSADWSPPNGYSMMIQSITPSQEWTLNTTSNVYVLTPTVGTASIGYKWDGTYLITNQPQPPAPIPPVIPPTSTPASQ